MHPPPGIQASVRVIIIGQRPHDQWRMLLRLFLLEVDSPLSKRTTRGRKDLATKRSQTMSHYPRSVPGVFRIRSTRLMPVTFARRLSATHMALR